MLTNKFLVTVWYQKDEKVIGEERWSGPSFDDALIIASYEFCKEMILAECKDKNTKFQPKMKVGTEYASKIECRITVTKEVDQRKIEETSPKILRTLGNQTIKIPKF